MFYKFEIEMKDGVLQDGPVKSYYYSIGKNIHGGVLERRTTHTGIDCILSEWKSKDSEQDKFYW